MLAVSSRITEPRSSRYNRHDRHLRHLFLTAATAHAVRGTRLALSAPWSAFRLGRSDHGGNLLLINEAKRLRIKQRWSRRTLELLSIRIDAPPVDMPTGCLIVANHTSWLDIFVINALRPAAFIAKSEVRRWPFIGWLSARNDTLFLHHDSRAHAREINREIAARLRHKADIAVFPEGTTSDGTLLHGFHATLLQPAIDAGRPLLPLALNYRDAHGNFSLAPSYAGEITLMQCFSAILACRTLTCGSCPHRRSFRSASRGARWPMPHMQPLPGSSAFNDDCMHITHCYAAFAHPSQRHKISRNKDDQPSARKPLNAGTGKR